MIKKPKAELLEIAGGEVLRLKVPMVSGTTDSNTIFSGSVNSYRLIWAKSCNWSNRSSIVRELLGLDDVIRVDIVDNAHTIPSLGWEFIYETRH